MPPMQQQTLIADLIAPYHAAPDLAPGPDPVIGLARGDDGAWTLTLVFFVPTRTTGVPAPVKAALPVIVDHVPTPAEQQQAGRPLWHLLKLAPGVWKLRGPAVPAGPLHFFMTLTDCPEPAPWEVSRLVLAS